VRGRFAVIAALAALACAFAAAPAGATNECRGLQVCVRVAGPWVLASPGQVEYQLACPKNYVVGGLDAEVTNRRIDVSFVGSLGSPVNPGITTSAAAVFLGRLVNGNDRAASFRPHIGCVPASGGGPRTPTAYHALAPGKPSVRHVTQIRVQPGRTQHVVAKCPHSEALVAATHAIGFYGDAPPTASLARSVHAAQSVHGQSVIVTIQTALAVAGNRAVVQIDLVCAAL
jgi:hypothetical protein